MTKCNFASASAYEFFLEFAIKIGLTFTQTFQLL